MNLPQRYIALALTGILAFPLLQAQDASKPANAPLPQETRKLGGPGQEHEQLAKYAGTWELAVTMGAAPRALKYTGMATNRMTVGGRFLEMEYSATGGTNRLEGQFGLGFDGRHKHYALIAKDSFGTYFVTSQGSRDPTTGKIKMRGTDDDPQMKAMGYTKEFAHVVDFRSRSEFAVEVWLVDTRTAERREFKYMDYTFQRKE